jgi:hypothetical protein
MVSPCILAYAPKKTVFGLKLRKNSALSFFCRKKQDTFCFGKKDFFSEPLLVS